MNKIRRYISDFLLKKRRNTKYPDRDLKFIAEISKLVGFKIQDVELYREAFSLKKNSKDGSCSKNYERLEFLGDAMIGSIISYYLYENYPNHNEGYLTQMKSKIVNRQNLNRLGEQLCLTSYIQNSKLQVLGENISGNLLEALVGAVYLDANYEMCQSVVERWLLNPSEITRIENKIVSYKSLLLEWGQKKKVKIQYETAEELLPNKSICFRCWVLLNEEKIGCASESSKKKAEEKAAKRAFYALNKRENILEK